MNSTVLKEIIAFLFGRKYYANTIGRRGVVEPESLSSFVFSNKETADRHRLDLESNASFYYVETISFRSRRIYK